MKSCRLLALVAFFAISPPASAFNLGKELGHCFHGGCDAIWTLNQRIDDGVRSKSESLVGPAKAAFDDSMRLLFDNRINPLLDRLNGDLSGRIDQAATRAGQILNETQTGILKIIDRAAEVALETKGNVESLLKIAFESTNALEEKINADVTALVDDVDCKVNGTKDGLIDWLRRLPTIPHPFDACYTNLNYYASVPDSTDYVNWYRITKCEYVQDLDNSKTVLDVKYNYARLSNLARRTACVLQDAVSKTQLSDEARTFSEQYDLWRLASRR